MGLRGEFSRLNRLIHTTEKMTQPSWRQGLARTVAEAALEQIALSFERERDPWDRPWKRSLRAQLEQGQTLSDTGRLRRSFTYRANDRGFIVGTNVRYAAIHQYGGVIRPKRAKYLRFRLAGGSGKRKGGRGRWVQTERVVIPARPFVPEPRLSPRWEQAFADAAQRYFQAP
ncbi:MAG: phage virion morphogenesis protein [Meiothermus ruber]|uniref:phage virion morphogenesis protein n=1 Tax=Meiothermus sp. TaxID=1955249 RepID=UPI0025D9D512|nr:phage virion morphogenesis protein [Meiothermus sp.]MCS7069092.1 phage virion morphogenesis protein [Meiothermus sp.]MCX7802273.1 phage virion morphogenesis protein [Meiothermus ruber]